MLQRIQTVYMFLAGLSSIAFYYTLDRTEVRWLDLTFDSLFGIIVIGTFFNIFSYKNRKYQILRNRILIFINALLIILLGYWLLNLSGGIDFPEKGIEPIFPFISLVCLCLANLFIKRDDRLVKSVDRLR